MAYFDHLRSLIEGLKDVEAGQKAELVKNIAVADADKRAVVLAAVDAERPGMSKQLQDIWLDFRARAVHFFFVPCFDGAGYAELSREIAQKYGDEAASGGWHVLEKAHEEYEPYVSGVRLSAEELELRVHLYFERYASVDGELNPYRTDLNVDIQIDFGRKGGRVAAVFATTGAARHALRLALEDFFGVQIPHKKCRAQEKYMVAVRLTEVLAKKLARELNLKTTEMDGIDPKNRLGGYSVYGKSQGLKRLPLDADDPRVKERERAGNGTRDYSYDFDHSDGFREWVEARFTFTGLHPHVTFTTVSSRPAKNYLLDAIRDRLV